ncbi:hypothetical protein B0H66DRAFT_533552 [Apodospora peruviana]|uniref:Ankyrin repeat protein n=1 Tax=Apodospora peruviana TaxID=516989 RepID=A0AAE0I635_9PEZI|nr:hypothetical protein B0H66DRAFT_533552 [Apodospora peruviana]
MWATPASNLDKLLSGPIWYAEQITALHTAAMRGDVDMCRFIVENRTPKHSGIFLQMQSPAIRQMASAHGANSTKSFTRGQASHAREFRDHPLMPGSTDRALSTPKPTLFFLLCRYGWFEDALLILNSMNLENSNPRFQTPEEREFIDPGLGVALGLCLSYRDMIPSQGGLLQCHLEDSANQLINLPPAHPVLSEASRTHMHKLVNKLLQLGAKWWATEARTNTFLAFKADIQVAPFLWLVAEQGLPNVVDTLIQHGLADDSTRRDTYVQMKKAFELRMKTNFESRHDGPVHKRQILPRRLTRGAGQVGVAADTTKYDYGAICSTFELESFLEMARLAYKDPARHGAAEFLDEVLSVRPDASLVTGHSNIKFKTPDSTIVPGHRAPADVQFLNNEACLPTLVVVAAASEIRAQDPHPAIDSVTGRASWPPSAWRVAAERCVCSCAMALLSSARSGCQDTSFTTTEMYGTSEQNVCTP